MSVNCLPVVCVTQKQRDAELDGMMTLKLDFPQSNAFLLVCNFFSFLGIRICSVPTHVILVVELNK